VIGRRVVSWLQGHVIAVDLLLTGVLMVVFGPWAISGSPMITMFSAALIIPLAWRRRAPAGSAATVCAVAFVQWLVATGDDSIRLLPADVAVCIAVYTVTGYGSRLASSLVLAAGLTGALLEAPLLSQDQEAFPKIAGGLAVCVVSAWALGFARRVRSEQVEALRERAQMLEAERERQDHLAAAAERARIARELHDIVAHSLSVVIAQADGGRYAARTDPEAADAALSTIAETGRRALAEMRHLLGVLRQDVTSGPVPVTTALATAPPATPSRATRAPAGPRGGSGEPRPVVETLPSQEVSTAPQPTIDDLDDLLASVRGGGMPVDLAVEGEPRPVPQGMSLAMYRIVQEGLTNVIKHAGPGAVAAVGVRWQPEGVEVTVEDDGRGGAATGPVAGGGRGLLGMRERAAMYGGEVDTGPRPGGGYRVRVRFPVRSEHSEEGG